MAESITQPGPDSTEEPGGTITESKAPAIDGAQQTSPSAPTTQSTIIWTPRFISLFFLTLVIGLSAESLLTQGWLNGWYMGVWVLGVHIVLVLGCMIAILFFTRTWWVRLGSIFGILWVVFVTLDLLVNFQQIDPDSLILAYVNTAMCMALCGSFISFSIDRASFRSWDAWFFRLAAIFGGCMVVLNYFFPAEDHTLVTLVYSVAVTALLLCILVWWARPPCWKTRPGPAFLFGIVPLILLSLSIYNRGIIHTNFFLYQIVGFSLLGRATDEPNFLFTQLALLFLLLGTMRILQGEIRRSLALK